MTEEDLLFLKQGALSCLNLPKDYKGVIPDCPKELFKNWDKLTDGKKYDRTHEYRERLAHIGFFTILFLNMKESRDEP